MPHIFILRLRKLRVIRGEYDISVATPFILLQNKSRKVDDELHNFFMIAEVPS